MTNKIDKILDKSFKEIDENTFSEKSKKSLLKKLVKESPKIAKLFQKFNLKEKMEKIDDFLPIFIDIFNEEKKITTLKVITTLDLNLDGDFIAVIENNEKYSNLLELIKFPYLAPFDIKIFENSFFKNFQKNFLEKQEFDFKNIFFESNSSKKSKYLGVYEKSSLNFSNAKKNLFINLANLFIRNEKNIIFTSYRKLSDALKATFGNSSQNREFVNYLKEVDALFITNIDLGSLNKWSVDEIFWNILIGRIENKKMTFINSSLPLEKFAFIITANSQNKINFFLDETYNSINEKKNFFFKMQVQEMQKELEKLLQIEN